MYLSLIEYSGNYQGRFPQGRMTTSLNLFLLSNRLKWWYEILLTKLINTKQTKQNRGYIPEQKNNKIRRTMINLGRDSLRFGILLVHMYMNSFGSLQLASVNSKTDEISQN